MASIGSLSFFIETAMDTSVIHCGNFHRPRFLILGSRGRTTLDLGSNVTMKLSANYDNMIDECNRRRPWRSKSMRINAKKGEDRDKPEDALEATIQKSKKVLAMQKQLLDQIAERRKLVSYLKNSLLNPEEEVVSYKATDNSFSNLSHASDGAGGTYASSTAVSASDSISESFGESEKESEQRLPFEIFSSHEDSPVIDKTDSDAVHFDVLPSFLSKTSEPHGLEENEEEKSSEKNSEDVTIEANKAPEEEDTKPPPLAGANVMNIILVAAECAPWSKT
ncbi:Granule-bound starch synthase 2, chloroplastic/amyloplastic, partial [Thalictrum thalictroides]